MSVTRHGFATSHVAVRRACRNCDYGIDINDESSSFDTPMVRPPAGTIELDQEWSVLVGHPNRAVALTSLRAA